MPVFVGKLKGGCMVTGCIGGGGGVDCKWVGRHTEEDLVAMLSCWSQIDAKGDVWPLRSEC